MNVKAFMIVMTEQICIASSIDNTPAGWDMIGDPFKDRLPNHVIDFVGIPGSNPEVF